MKVWFLLYHHGQNLSSLQVIMFEDISFHFFMQPPIDKLMSKKGEAFDYNSKLVRL